MLHAVSLYHKDGFTDQRDLNLTYHWSNGK